MDPVQEGPEGHLLFGGIATGPAIPLGLRLVILIIKTILDRVCRARPLMAGPQGGGPKKPGLPGADHRKLTPRGRFPAKSVI